jgi:hypothetical protein
VTELELRNNRTKEAIRNKDVSESPKKFCAAKNNERAQNEHRIQKRNSVR